jgi:hypothetical protein
MRHGQELQSQLEVLQFLVVESELLPLVSTGFSTQSKAIQEVPGHGYDVPGMIQAADGGFEVAESDSSCFQDGCDVGSPGNKLVTGEQDEEQVCVQHPAENNLYL